MKKLKLVMVGNGMAGVRTLEELLKLAPDVYDITVFGAEPYANYNRILLSPVLAGEQTIQDIMLNDVDWYEQNNITLHLGKKITKIDRYRRLVIAEDGTTAEYDRLLLATGSNPFVLPVPGKDLEGVISYRDIQDTNAMIEAAAKYKQAIVIGGGLLGLEAANGLKLRGMEVSVVHLSDTLMERQLDTVAGKMLQKSLEERGLNFLLKKNTQEILGDEKWSRQVGALQRRQRSAGAAGGDGGRHSPQHHAGGVGRPALQSRHRRQRHHADFRSAHLCRRRMRQPPRHRLRPGGAACSRWPGCAPTIWPTSASAATRVRSRRPS